MSIGYDLNPQTVGNDFQRIYDALFAYKNLYGSVEMQQRFIVPEFDTGFPEQCWGMALGKTVHHIRFDRYYSKFADRFRDLGVVIVNGEANVLDATTAE